MSYAVVLGSVLLSMISPGPNVLIVTQTALSDTRRTGIVTALGVAAGSTLWSSAALFCLSVVFAQFAWLYSGLRLLGGMDLLFLGIKLWRTAEHPLVPSSSTHATVHTDRQAFRLGFLTNLTNPKAIVFFGSIVAALLAPALPMWVKLAAIGIVAVDMTGWHVALDCFFSTRRARQVYRRIKRWVDRAAGASLALLGLRLMLSSRKMIHERSAQHKHLRVELSNAQTVAPGPHEGLGLKLLYSRNGDLLMDDRIVFTRGVPPPEAFPTDELSECFDAAIRNDTAVVLQYGQQPGYAPLRAELAREYGVSDTEILVGNGSLQLQDLVSAHLIGPGMTVYTEQPSYDRAILTFRRRGARTVGIPLEEDGISVERLEAALEREVPAFLYLVPDFQNPAGATLSLEKRQRVVELANRHGFWVIEDIPYRKLRYEGEDLPLLREIDPSRVITMSSFSKLLSPGIRVGFMIAPEVLVRTITNLGEDTYLSPVLPTQAAVAEYLRRGWLAPNVERLKELYRPRWQKMADAVSRELPDSHAFLPDGGFFVSVMLPEDATTDNLVGRAKDVGLVLTPGTAFFADPGEGEAVQGDRFVRLPFCAVTPDQIEEGVRRLASLV